MIGIQQMKNDNWIFSHNLQRTLSSIIVVDAYHGKTQQAGTKTR